MLYLNKDTTLEVLESDGPLISKSLKNLGNDQIVSFYYLIGHSAECYQIGAMSYYIRRAPVFFNHPKFFTISLRFSVLILGLMGNFFGC